MPRMKEKALTAELAKRGFESISVKREHPDGRVEVEANKLHPVPVEGGADNRAIRRNHHHREDRKPTRVCAWAAGLIRLLWRFAAGSRSSVRSSFRYLGNPYWAHPASAALTHPMLP
jgi:hypothetical protein